MAKSLLLHIFPDILFSLTSAIFIHVNNEGFFKRSGLYLWIFDANLMQIKGRVDRDSAFPA